jgi:IS5 family transposase
MGMVYGFKLHALVNAHGLFERWSFAPANVAEVKVAPELSEGLQGQLIAGDKAYIGHPSITTPKRKNMKSKCVWNKTLSRLRKRIESSFSVLVRSFTLHVAQVKTFWSLRARVNLKITAHNLSHSGLL